MSDEIEVKSPGLNNPEIHVLTYNRFNTYMVLIFSDLKKAQIYKMPNRVSPHREIEIVMNFDYQHLFKPFGLDGKETNENFLFKIEDKKYIYVGDKVYSFETIDDIEEYFSECGFNDVKYPFALSKENVYYTIHQKYVSIKEYGSSPQEGEYKYLYKKDSELKRGDITDESAIE